MQHLDFLIEMDKEKREEYMIEIVQIVKAEDQADEWRFSQTFKPKSRYPVIRAKTGHITKLENEGIVTRTYSSNSKTRYQLNVSREELQREINELGDSSWS